MYLVKLILSSSEIVESSRYIDEQTKELKLKYDKETRQKIEYVREKYRRLAYRDAVQFHGLHLVSDDKLDEIRTVAREANTEMQAIAPDLYAKLVAVPISEETIREGELYEQIYYAILAQMSKTLLDHIKNLKSDTPSKRTRKTLSNLLDKFEELNILGDRRITEKIQEIRKIVNMRTDEMKKTIMADLDYVLEQLKNF